MDKQSFPDIRIQMSNEYFLHTHTQNLFDWQYQSMDFCVMQDQKDNPSRVVQVVGKVESLFGHELKDRRRGLGKSFFSFARHKMMALCTFKDGLESPIRLSVQRTYRMPSQPYPVFWLFDQSDSWNYAPDILLSWIFLFDNNHDFGF